MKLIDILVGKGDGMELFGVHTKYLAMDPDGRVYGYTEIPTPSVIGWSVPGNSCSTDGRGCLIQIDRDDIDGQWQSAIITRDQYEAALAEKENPLPWDEKKTDTDGWIEWSGGKCPVPSGTLVDVKHRGGEVYQNKPALGDNNVRWSHVGSRGDIIAYRLHQPQQVGHTEAEQEADLNECIGQAPVTGWNGEGLPPVGCECEFMKHTLDAMPNWRRGIIKYVSEYTVVIVEALSPGEFVAHPRTCDFRPVRTEAERKRDIATQSMKSVWREVAGKEVNGKLLSIYEVIYDAIAAGKIHGVKLED